MEVLHRADLLAKLEGTGTSLLHAVQIAAIEQASATGRQTPEVIKELNRLASALFDRVIEDKRKDRIPLTDTEEFAALADTVADKPNGSYVFDCALAMHLREYYDWNEKIVELLRIAETRKPESPGDELLHTEIDEILAEIILTPSALAELIGKTDNYADTLIAHLKLFLGEACGGAYGADQGLDRMARHFRAGEFPIAHAGLGERILAGIESQKRLRMDTTESELRAFRDVATLAQKGIGPHLPRRKLMPLLELRSSRFVEPDTMKKCLDATVLPDEKIDWLFLAADSIVGAKYRYRIADMIFRFATADSFARRFHASRQSIPQRLKRLGDLSRQAMKTHFDKDQRLRMAGIFDAVACDLVKTAKLFENIEARKIPVAQKVLLIVNLFKSGSITEGKLSAQARQRILAYINQPGFINSYFSYCAQTSGPDFSVEKALTAMVRTLMQAGIAPERILKTFETLCNKQQTAAE